MTPSRYLGVVLAFAAAFFLGGNVAAGAEPPTLGGRLSPVPMTYEKDPRVNVTNLSTVPITARLEVEGPGWALEADTFSLSAGERRTVAVVTAGEDDALLSVVLTPNLPDGTDASVLVLQGRLRHVGPWEDVPLIPLLIVGLCAGLVILWMVRRRLER